MTELLLLYWPTALATFFISATLSVVGAFLVTRQAAVQTIAVSQSAGLGVSIGLLISQLFFSESHIEHTAIPLGCGLAVSAAGFALTERVARNSHSPTVVYLSAFGFFWGLAQLLVGFFPVVESHATALYFGDLVTLTKNEAFFFLGFSALIAIYLALLWKRISARAFLSAILGEPLRFTSAIDLSFYVVALTLVCLSVQLLGLLFTISCLFIPTAVYSFSTRVGVKRHLVRVAMSAAIAASIGFLISLAESRFLTTPLITVIMVLLPIAHIFSERIIFRCK